MSGDTTDLIYDLVKEIDRKQDSQNEKLAKLEVHVEQNTKSLDHHIKRTDLLEQALSQHKSAVIKKIQEIEAPKNTAKTLAKWIAGVAGFIGVVAGAVYAVMRIYKL